MCNLNALAFQRIDINAKAVILAGDFNSACQQIFDGMICASMTELEFVGFPAQGKPEQLMAETDAEDGQLSEKASYGLNGITYGGRVAGAVAEKDAVRFEAQDLPGRCVSGNDLHIAAVRAKQAKDIVFHAKIEGDDPIFLSRFAFLAGHHVDDAFIPAISLSGGNTFNDVPANQARVRCKFFPETIDIQISRRNNASHRAFGANMFYELSCVYSFEADDIVFPEVFAEGGTAPPVARAGTVFLDDKAGGKNFSRFGVGDVRAVVANQRIRHSYDLLIVRWVGEDFLIAGHTRIKNDLSALLAFGSKRTSFEYRTILK